MTETAKQGCPRCGIGTPIFTDSCIVCCTVNDSIASLIKELLTQKLAAEAALSEAHTAHHDRILYLGQQLDGLMDHNQAVEVDLMEAKQEAALSEAQQERDRWKAEHYAQAVLHAQYRRDVKAEFKLNADDREGLEHQVTQQAATIRKLREIAGDIATAKALRETNYAQLQTTITQQAYTIQRLENHEIALHFTALAIAREQLLHMVGPLEVNEVLTTMDEACELAEQSPSLVESQDKRISEQAATISHLARALDAAIHALRSYEHGNASQDIARLVANACVEALSGLPKEKP